MKLLLKITFFSCLMVFSQAEAVLTLDDVRALDSDYEYGRREVCQYGMGPFLDGTPTMQAYSINKLDADIIHQQTVLPQALPHPMVPNKLEYVQRFWSPDSTVAQQLAAYSFLYKSAVSDMQILGLGQSDSMYWQSVSYRALDGFIQSTLAGRRPDQRGMALVASHILLGESEGAFIRCYGEATGQTFPLFAPVPPVDQSAYGMPLQPVSVRSQGAQFSYVDPSQRMPAPAYYPQPLARPVQELALPTAAPVSRTAITPGQYTPAQLGMRFARLPDGGSFPVLSTDSITVHPDNRSFTVTRLTLIPGAPAGMLGRQSWTFSN